MKSFTIAMAILLFLFGCNDTSHQQENSENLMNGSLGVQHNNAAEQSIIIADPGSILFETSRILDKIEKTENCQFEYAEKQCA